MNPTLPIIQSAHRIATAVNNHPVVVVVGDTGTGKSTQVPQILDKAGYDVILTQPRRPAARMVAQRIADEMGTSLGELVGYRMSREQRFSPQSRILVCTDGLQLVRELMGRGIKRQVLVIDEVHERSRNIDTLMAWVKYRFAQGDDIKVVLMSATVNAQKLSAYYDNAPIISVPGRVFPVETIPVFDRNFWTPSQLTRWGFTSYDDVPTEPAAWCHLLAAKGHNTLVFQNGRSDIEKTVEELEELGTPANILPLYGEMTAEEQNRVFQEPTRTTLVVSTNVAQTSVTIDYIDAVVDPGTEKRTELRNEVEGLYIGDTSQADCIQRKGRAGRTKPGLYIDCSQVPFAKRSEFSVPEIMRTRHDQLVLRLADMGLDATVLPFLDQPKLETLLEAKEALIRLDALNKDGTITDIGRAMSWLPVDVHLARMIVGAEKKNTLEEVLTIVACVQVKGIRGKGRREDGIWLPPRWPSLTEERDSDLLAELDCFMAAWSMSNQERHASDILVKRFHAAKEIRTRLAGDLGVSLHPTAPNDRQEVLKACVAGMVDHLYRHNGSHQYVGAELPRAIDKNSVVQEADWVVATPLDLEVELTSKFGEKYKKTLYLLTFVTKVDPVWLALVAPQLVTYEQLGFCYIAELDDIAFATAVVFNGQRIGITASPAHACPEATLALATALAKGEIDYPNKAHNDSLKMQIDRLSRRDSRIEQLTTARLADIFAARLETIYQVAGLAQIDLRLEAADLLPEGLLSLIANFDPEIIEIDGVQCYVTYNISWSVRATIRINARDFLRLWRLPVLPKASSVERVEIVDDDGNVVAQGYSLVSAGEEFRRKERLKQFEVERKQMFGQIEELQLECSKLEALGRGVTRLRGIIAEASAKLAAAYAPQSSSFSNAKALLQQAQQEVERLSGDATELLLEDLMTGRIAHPDIQVNQAFCQQMASYAIRSGGFFEPLTEEQLRAHYAERLEGATRVDEVLALNLQLDPEHYAPEAWLAEVELAPETIELASRKGATPVVYSYEGVGNERVAVGTIRISLSTYERNCAEYGRKSTFPVLPHGIRLVIEVTVENQVVATGEDDKGLQAQLKKYLKAKQRGRNTPKEDELGFKRQAPLQATPAPYWHKRNR